MDSNVSLQTTQIILQRIKMTHKRNIATGINMIINNIISTYKNTDMSDTKEKQKSNSQSSSIKVVYTETKEVLKEDFTMHNPPAPPKKERQK